MRNVTESPNVIGIVGGMGPQAGITLYNHLLAHTPAVSDQDHLPVIMMSFGSDIGDRTEFLDGKLSLNPGHAIAKVIGKLAHSGASVVGIACNTAHAPEIFDVVLKEVHECYPTLTILNMLEEVCRDVNQQFKRGSRIGLMATNGTYKTKIYSKALEDRGYKVILPPPEFQNDVIHRLIYDPHVGIKSNPRQIKAGTYELFTKGLSFFRQHDADAVILGCTELSIIVQDSMTCGIKVLDSSESLAKALVREALK